MEPTATSPAFLAPRPKGSATALAELLAFFRSGGWKAQARGVSGAARGYVLAQLARDSKRPLVCVEPDEEAAEALEKDLQFFAGSRAVVRIPATSEPAPGSVIPRELISSPLMEGTR